ncbi:cyclic lactone autoinducer peptide [Sedimentibacter sp.]|nr:cyclic lactone autoinducer peptide [Sedimentibacter sp.]
MEELKYLILKNIAEQIKKTAQASAGTTSFWNMYQPKEPKVIERIEK